LNTAVSKLREVLGDSAEEHRYVETLARRGYRFAGTVEELSALSGSVGRELHIAEKRIEPDIVVVEIGGRITFGPECHQVEWLIAHLLAEDEKKIILDISHVTRGGQHRSGDYRSLFRQGYERSGTVESGRYPGDCE
jgi:hypothetical protein